MEDALRVRGLDGKTVHADVSDVRIAKRLKMEEWAKAFDRDWFYVENEQ